MRIFYSNVPIILNDKATFVADDYYLAISKSLQLKNSYWETQLVPGSIANLSRTITKYEAIKYKKGIIALKKFTITDFP